MAANHDPPDEIQYRRPDIIEWWMSEGGRPMDENMIHRYISEASFFDWQSKNGLLLDQSKVDFNAYRLVHNRKEFEANLRSKPGIEFLIVGEPQPVAEKTLAAQGVTTGVYVIRKQDRRRAPDGPRVRPPHVLVEKTKDGTRDLWEITILGTYFVAGDSAYQAPSVFDVVGNRLLSAASSLNKFLDMANDLPRHAPALGHHYLPPQAPKQTTEGSVATTPTRSREGSVAPGEEARSLRSGSINANSQLGGLSGTANAKDSALLADSLRMTLTYGNEFTDENPLLGEPGSLRFTTSMAAVKKRRADEEAAAAKAKAEKESASTSRVATPKIEKAPSPPTVFSTETKTAKGEKSERRSKEKKRRKSKHGGTATSPTTPSSATTPRAPDSAI